MHPLKKLGIHSKLNFKWNDKKKEKNLGIQILMVNPVGIDVSLVT